MRESPVFYYYKPDLIVLEAGISKQDKKLQMNAADSSFFF